MTDPVLFRKSDVDAYLAECEATIAAMRAKMEADAAAIELRDLTTLTGILDRAESFPAPVPLDQEPKE